MVRASANALNHGVLNRNLLLPDELMRAVAATVTDIRR